MSYEERRATESSETSSQCTSSDSVTGLSTLTIAVHPSITMDSFNNNESSSFLCSSTPSSTMASPLMFQKEEDLQPNGTNFITANKTSHIAVGLSTVV
ncbi:hypothetical protein D4764_10G0003250 [Takifugu flavidus]|uniref:Uncharacterized protein n=1 Tax=Takifugu flavidus TaxID=433684 RepID=A0A5C6PIS0_9TELE|nr:hypothetical protein D4764_10G0003250 [Takifugu flavidus]